MTDRPFLRIAAAVLTTAALAACTGAGPTPVVPRAEAPAAAQRGLHHGKATAVFSLRIPRPDKHRRPHYVSPSTASVTVAVYDSTHTHLYSSVTVDTVPGFGGCTQIVNASFTCTLTTVAPAGVDAFDVTAYDEPGATGSTLSLVADQLVTIQSGKANQIPMVLGGVPSLVAMTLASTSPLVNLNAATATIAFAGTGAAVAQEIQLSAQDADGNEIVGPGLPAFELVSNDTNDLAIAPVSGSPGLFKLTPLHPTSVAITLTGGATPVQGKGGTVLANASVQIGPILYVSNNVGYTIEEYASWSSAPILTIPMSSGLANPFTMTTDSAGNLYVMNFTLAGTVEEFAPGATTPSRTITGLDGPFVGLAVDAAGDIFVSEGVSQDVKEFTPAGGNTPSRTLSSSTSPGAIDQPAGLALDAAGNLYVANYAGSVGVSIFAPGTSTTPLETFDAGMSEPYCDAVDASGNLYVANYSGNNVTEYSPPFSSASTAARTFATPNTQKPQSLALDSLGDLYVGTGTGNVVEFAPSAAVVRSILGFATTVPSLAIDPSNDVYVPTDIGNLVAEFGPGASAGRVATFQTGIDDPLDVVSFP